MLQIGMDSPSADQTQEMETGGFFLYMVCRGQKCGILEKTTVGYRHVDSGQVLINYAAGTQIQVAGLGVSGLAFGQADRFTMGNELGMHIGGTKRRDIGSVR